MVRFSSSLLVSFLVATAAPGNVDGFRNNGNARPGKGAPVDRTAPTPAVAPMPFKWPVVGTLPNFIRRGGVGSLSEVYETMYRDYGSVFGMSLMGMEETVFSDPRVLDQALRKEGKFPIGGAESVTNLVEYYEENDMKMALGLSARGEQWKSTRTELNADLYVLWDTYIPVIAETCRKISRVAGRDDLHIADFLSRSAFDMFASVLYGESPETTNTQKARPDDIAFVKSAKRAFDITGALLADPLAKVMGTNTYKEFLVNMDNTMNTATELGVERIRLAQKTKANAEEEEKKEEKQSGSSRSGSGECPITAVKKRVGLNRQKVVPTDYANPSFIERLVNRESLSPEDIAEVQAPLLMAGVDTTAYVMNWFFLNMASNPDAQTKLAKELHETLQDEDITSVEVMDSLVYLKACFRESHRLTPSSPVYAKTLENDIDVTTLDEQKSFRIPAGRKVTLNLRGMPMDPKYVQNPTSFIPERFLPEAVEARKGTPSEIALDHPAMSDPFGRGKRKCLGANIAKVEMMILAARLFQDWEISLVDPKEAVHSPSKTWKTTMKLLLIADPYPAMKLTPRRKPLNEGSPAAY